MSVPQPPSVSASPSSGPKPSTSGPNWDPRSKYFQTRLRFGLLLALVAAITLGVIYWVATQNITQAEVKPLAVGANLTLILAPVLAASAGVERFLETIFTIVEGNARALVAYLGRGMRWLHNAESEVDNARQWLANVSTEYNRQLKELPFSGMTSVVSMRTPEATSPPTGTPGQPATASLDSQQIFALADTRLKSAQRVDESGYKTLATGRRPTERCNGFGRLPERQASRVHLPGPVAGSDCGDCQLTADVCLDGRQSGRPKN